MRAYPGHTDREARPPQTVGPEIIRSLLMTLGLTITYVEDDGNEDKAKLGAIGGVAREDPVDLCFRAPPGRPRVPKEDFPPRVFFSQLEDFYVNIIISTTRHRIRRASEPWGGMIPMQRQPHNIRDRARRAVRAGVRDSSCTCVPVRTNMRTTISPRSKYAIMFVGSYANL